MDPNDICQKIRDHLDKHGFSDVGIKVLMAVPAQKLSVTDDVAKAGLARLRFLEHQTLRYGLRRGASGPMGFFSKMLGVKLLGATGMGYASGHSAPNEFLVIEGDGKVGGLSELERSFVDLLYSYAAYPEEF